MSHAYINDQGEYCLELAEGIVVGANAVAMLERDRIVALLERSCLDHDIYEHPCGSFAEAVGLIKGEQK